MTSSKFEQQVEPLRTALIDRTASHALLDKARRRPELAEVELVDGGVERLPFQPGTFDFTLSLLVLQEFSDRPQALGEMRRVTRPRACRA